MTPNAKQIKQEKDSMALIVAAHAAHKRTVTITVGKRSVEMRLTTQVCKGNARIGGQRNARGHITGGTVKPYQHTFVVARPARGLLPVFNLGAKGVFPSKVTNS